MNSRKINKRREEHGLLYSHQQSWNPKQAITLKHLITYSNPITYINSKGMIGMPVTDCHVWGHAYGHDKPFLFTSGLKNLEISFAAIFMGTVTCFGFKPWALRSYCSTKWIQIIQLSSSSLGISTYNGNANPSLFVGKL